MAKHLLCRIGLHKWSRRVNDSGQPSHLAVTADEDQRHPHEHERGADQGGPRAATRPNATVATAVENGARNAVEPATRPPFRPSSRHQLWFATNSKDGDVGSQKWHKDAKFEISRA
jgi:hypothetical protein